MAALSGTTQTYDNIGLREDLSDVIFDLFPEDTWCLSNFDREEASATLTEWLAQELAAPAINASEEGGDGVFASLTPPSRYSTHLQISSKTFIVSDTNEAVNKAGRKSDVARGAIVKMREMKRDMESAICGRQISSEGGAGTARTTAGMEAWIGDATASVGGPSHVVLASSASGYTTPPVTSGHPTTDSTVGTTPTLFAFTSTSLHYALQQVWENGGDARVILCDAGRKRAIDAFTSIATRFVDVSQGAQASITGAANVYVSDFGKHQVILNRYGGNGATADGLTVSTVLCIDPSYWAVRYLRRPFKRELAKTGDASKFQILCEWGLVARNWKANAKVVACAAG